MKRQVVLAEVQHVGACGQGDVGPVVDRQQRVVPAGGVGEDGQGLEFSARLQWPELLLTRRTLVPQLNDVDPARKGRIGEFGEVTALAPGVGAQIERGSGEAFGGFVHTATLATTVKSTHGSPGTGG